MAKVEIGSKVRDVHRWVDELATPTIKATREEMMRCLLEPKVDADDTRLAGQMYYEQSVTVDEAVARLGECRQVLLCLWGQHSIVDFPTKKFKPYKLVPRATLWLDDKALKKLLDHEDWLGVTKPVREVDLSALVAFLERKGNEELKKKFAELLMADCTPEIRPPSDSPKEVAKREKAAAGEKSKK